MGNVQSIPEGKLDRVSAEEREEFETFRTGSDNLYHAGINVEGGDSYDPYAGSKYDKTPVPHRDQPEPKLGTDRDDVPEAPKVISRNRNRAIDRSEATRTGSNGTVDKSEQRVVSSGRKNEAAK